MEAIAKYGSDALRLGLIANRSAGQNQAFSIDRVITGRNFCNKLWNIARYIENKIGNSEYEVSPQPKTLADHWIAREISRALIDVEKKIENYRFAEASDKIYHLIWDDVADWYIESSKSQDNPSMLAWVLDSCLRMTHPFAPFVTETIWQSLPWYNNLLMTEKWPDKPVFDDISAAEFTRLKKLVTEARFVITSLPNTEKYSLLYQNDSLIADNAELIIKLAKLKEVKYVEQARGIRLAASNREAWIDISTETLYEHQSNLEVRLAKIHSEIEFLEKRLANETYVQKAPAKLVEESRDQLEQKKTHAKRLIQELEVLK